MKRMKQLCRAEILTGISFGTVKMLTSYRNDELVDAVIEKWRRTNTDQERLIAFNEVASNSLKSTLKRLNMVSFLDIMHIDVSWFGSQRGIGQAKTTELMLLQKLFEVANGTETSIIQNSNIVVPPGKEAIAQADVQEEAFSTNDIRLSPLQSSIHPQEKADLPLSEYCIHCLSVRSRNILGRLGVPLTPRGIASLTREAILATQGGGRTVAAELMAFREKCLDGRVWEPIGQPPSNYSSLPDYLFDTLCLVNQTASKNANVYRHVLSLYLGLGNVEKSPTLEETGNAIGITRERVRQIAGKIMKSLFPKKGECHSTVSIIRQWAVELFQNRHGILSGEHLAKAADDQFGWEGTTPHSLVSLLSFMGEMVEEDDEGICCLHFQKNCRTRYQAFLDYVQDPQRDFLHELSFSAMECSAATIGLPDFSLSEYRFFARKALQKNKASAWGKFLRRELGESVPGAVIRRNMIISILQHHGREGMTKEEILNACRKENPEEEWDENIIRSIVDNSIYSKVQNIHIIGYRRGNIDSDSSYTLNSFFQDPNTKKIISEVGQEIREYMESSGFGVVSIWKIWNENQDRFAFEMPQFCFYSLLREFHPAGLSFPDYPRAYYPGIKKCDKDLYWEITLFFLLSGHATATSKQLCDFSSKCLWTNPATFGGTLHPLFRSTAPKKSRYQLYQLEQLSDPREYPPLLLSSFKPDPDFSFSSSISSRYTLHKDYLTPDGRAKALGVYARLFLRALSASDYSLTPDERQEFTDSGWCKRCLKLPAQLLLPVEENMGPPYTHWREQFNIGGELFWANRQWPPESKSLFDALAVRIASSAGFSFTPYPLP